MYQRHCHSWTYLQTTNKRVGCIQKKIVVNEVEKLGSSKETSLEKHKDIGSISIGFFLVSNMNMSEGAKFFTPLERGKKKG